MDKKQWQKDPKYQQLLEKRCDELWDKFYQDKFSQVYYMTYVETGDGEKAEKMAEETAEEYSDYILSRIMEEVEEETIDILEGREPEERYWQ